MPTRPHTTFSPARRLAVAGVALVALLGTAAACSDDDDASADTSSSTTAPAVADPADPADPAGESAMSAEACDGYAGLSAAMTGDPSAAGSALEKFESSMPSSLQDHAATVAEAMAAALEGDQAAMGEPTFTTAYAVIGDAVFDGCETSERMEITGVDYGFEGIPDTVAAGRVAVRFSNESSNEEPHEMILLRRTDAMTQSLDELAHMSPDELMPIAEMAGVVFAEKPDTASTSLLELEPGDYVAICTIPVGGGEQGDPHAAHGMIAEFEVTGAKS